MSVVIPAVQVDPLLEGTLASIRAQATQPGTEVEILIALKSGPGVALEGVRVINNPTGSIPVGLNAALAASSGDIIIRCDSRCNLPRDYITRCIEDLSDQQIGMVGGAQLVRDSGLIGGAYGIAFNSPLIGPSRHRYSRTSGPVDSPYLGAWRRCVLDELGGWDERLTRNQDNELADRVRETGLTVLYDHRLVVGYVAGRSLPQLLRHHFSFGYWRSVQRSFGQSAFTRRHKAALGGLAAGALLAGTVVRRMPARISLSLGAAGYALTVAIGSITSARLRSARPDLRVRSGPLSHLLAPALAIGVNASWLAGLIRGRSVHQRSEQP